MRRQFFHIVLSILLVVSTTGITLQKHFCGDVLQSVSLEKVAGCCSDNKSDENLDNGCCQNQAQEYKADGEYQAGNSLEITHTIALLPQLYLYLGSVSFTPSLKEFIAYTNSRPPPLLSNQYLSLIQQFRL